MITLNVNEIAAVIAAMPAFAPSLRAQRASCAAAFARAIEFQPNRTEPFDVQRFYAACGMWEVVAEAMQHDARRRVSALEDSSHD